MTPKQYEVQASQCGRLAERSGDSITKHVLLGIARAWLQLKEQTKEPEHPGGGATRRARAERLAKARRRGRAV
jgi:hypothetical protein